MSKRPDTGVVIAVYLRAKTQSTNRSGVGVFVAEKWIEKVFEVKRVFNLIILVKTIVCQGVLCLLSVYATPCGLSDSVKDLFYDQLRAVTAMIPASEFLIPCGDWNGHVGSTGSGYKEVHVGYGYGKPDPDSEGERILEYELAYDLFFCNTCFKKRDSHLITYRSGNTATQIDFMLFRKSLRKLVHQESVLSPLLFIIVLEALSREFRAGVPWEVLYADDLVIIADSLVSGGS